MYFSVKKMKSLRLLSESLSLGMKRHVANYPSLNNINNQSVYQIKMIFMGKAVGSFHNPTIQVLWVVFFCTFVDNRKTVFVLPIS